MHFNAQRTDEKIFGGFHLPDGIELPEHILFTHQDAESTGLLQSRDKRHKYCSQGSFAVSHLEFSI